MKWIGRLLDRAPDGSVEKYVTAEYGRLLRMMGWTAMFLVGMVVMAFPLWWSTGYIPPTDYGYMKSGQPVPMRTLLTPVITPRRVQNWVRSAITETLTLDFTNVEQRLKRAEIFYSPLARESMRVSVTGANIIDQIRTSAMKVSLTVLRPPVVRSRLEDYRGNVYWDLEVPVVINYVAASESASQIHLLKVRVKEVDPTQSPDGMEIVRFTTGPLQIR